MPRAEGVTEEQEALRIIERVASTYDEIEVMDWKFIGFCLDMHPDYIHRTYPNIKLAVYVDHDYVPWPHFLVGDEQLDMLEEAIALCQR